MWYLWFWNPSAKHRTNFVHHHKEILDESITYLILSMTCSFGPIRVTRGSECGSTLVLKMFDTIRSVVPDLLVSMQNWEIFFIRIWRGLFSMWSILVNPSPCIVKACHQWSSQQVVQNGKISRCPIGRLRSSSSYLCWKATDTSQECVLLSVPRAQKKLRHVIRILFRPRRWRFSVRLLVSLFLLETAKLLANPGQSKSGLLWERSSHDERCKPMLRKA